MGWVVYEPGSAEANLMANAAFIATCGDPAKWAKELITVENRAELKRQILALTGKGHADGPVNDIDTELIGTDECAQILGVDRRTVIRRRAELGGKQVGRRVYVFDRERILKKVREANGLGT